MRQRSVHSAAGARPASRGEGAASTAAPLGLRLAPLGLAWPLVAQPPTVPLAEAETSTETDTLAWIFVAALNAALTWPPMQSA